MLSELLASAYILKFWQVPCESSLTQQTVFDYPKINEMPQNST